MAITVTYDCTNEDITICGLDNKTQEITLETTAKCCSTPTGETYYLDTLCSTMKPLKVLLLNNYQYSNDYDPNTCTGWFSFDWSFTVDPTVTITSVTGTITVTIDGVSTITTVDDITDLDGSLQQYLTDPGATYEFDLNIQTSQGCDLTLTTSFTTVCGQCQCDTDLPTKTSLVYVVNDSPTPTFTLVEGCATIEEPLEDGVIYIDISTDEESNGTYSSCILVDCDDLLCKLTKKIADNILCTNCDENLDESFELYLEYQMLFSLLDCEKCCQACQLYNKIDNGLSKCSSC